VNHDSSCDDSDSESSSDPSSSSSDPSSDASAAGAGGAAARKRRTAAAGARTGKGSAGAGSAPDPRWKRKPPKKLGIGASRAPRDPTKARAAAGASSREHEMASATSMSAAARRRAARDAWVYVLRPMADAKWAKIGFITTHAGTSLREAQSELLRQYSRGYPDTTVVRLLPVTNGRKAEAEFHALCAVRRIAPGARQRPTECFSLAETEDAATVFADAANAVAAKFGRELPPMLPTGNATTNALPRDATFCRALATALRISVAAARAAVSPVDPDSCERQAAFLSELARGGLRIPGATEETMRRITLAWSSDGLPAKKSLRNRFREIHSALVIEQSLGVDEWVARALACAAAGACDKDDRKFRAADIAEQVAKNPWQFVGRAGTGFDVASADAIFGRVGLALAIADARAEAAATAADSTALTAALVALRARELTRILLGEIQSGVAKEKAEWPESRRKVFVAKEGVCIAGIALPFEAIASAVRRNVHGHGDGDSGMRALLREAGAALFFRAHAATSGMPLPPPLVFCQAADFEAAKSVASSLRMLLRRTPAATEEEDRTTATAAATALSPTQLQAVDGLNKEQLGIIAFADDPAVRIATLTGTAGTGKTRCIRALKARLPPGTPIVGAALAWSAAKVLQCASGVRSESLHKLFRIPFSLAAEDCGDDSTFARGTVFVIDEASMIDLRLFAHVTRAVAATRESRLLLVGDEGQLPPIGEGCPFREILRIPEVVHVRLVQQMRTSADDALGIVALAESYRQFGVPGLDSKFAGGRGVTVIVRDAEDAIVHAAVDIVASAWHTHDGSDTSVVVPPPIIAVAPTNALVGKIAAGVQLARQHQQSPPGEDRCFGSIGVRDNEWLVVKQNFVLGENKRRFTKATFGFFTARRGLSGVGVEDTHSDEAVLRGFNEDTPFFCVPSPCGYVSLASIESGETEFAVPVTEAALSEYFDLGYCVTVHKAQGLQAAHAVFAMPAGYSPAMTRELAYTAATRAKSMLTIVGPAWRLTPHARALPRAKVFSAFVEDALRSGSEESGSVAVRP
jgi:hypothetical protein